MKDPVFGTFGIYRWLLALLVLVTHLGPAEYKYCGGYAVQAFFVLSGYVTTFILNTHYLHLPLGRVRFYSNRALRIYPLYWAALALSFMVVLRFPAASHELNIYMNMPADAADWICNFLALGLTSFTGTLSEHMLVPVAWSLNVEILWWLAIPWIACSWPRAKLWLRIAAGFAALVAVIILIPGHDLAGMRYYSPLAGMLPFALGALLYWRKALGMRDLSNRAGLAIGAACLVITLFGHALFRHPRLEGGYWALPLNTLFIYYLTGLDVKSLPARLARADYWLGRISYPLFLLHIATGVLIRIFLPALAPDSWAYYIACALHANALALFACYAVERPVELLRRRIRS